MDGERAAVLGLAGRATLAEEDRTAAMSEQPRAAYFRCRCGHTTVYVEPGEPVFAICPECGPMFAVSADTFEAVEAVIYWMANA